MSQQNAAHLMKCLVDLWTIAIYGMNDVTLILEKVKSWQDQTVKAIKTSRYRENHLDNLSGFKPAILAVEEKLSGQVICPVMLCKADFVYGRIEPAIKAARYLADEILTAPPDLFSAWTLSKEKDSKSAHRARLRQATQDNEEIRPLCLKLCTIR